MPKKKIKATQIDAPEIASSEPAAETEVPRIEIADPAGDETGAEVKTPPHTESRPETGSEIEAAEEETPAKAEILDNPDAGSAPGIEEPRTEEPKASEPVPEEPAVGESGESEPEFSPKPHPPAKLERLQKILAQAGVASRRKAEELIEQGRVQVNGKVVTELGTKADAARDHIRVDGKLLQGAERLRYFVLNKPKGYVTTVRDPEGRPTVMQFFEKMRERLYPVGRLDYMSEGLLLVTNDGELANRLTRASAGVEKTYLVKVAGQPTEGELDILRSGVAIERGKPGSAKVRTSPARIRQVRQGDNPWYEVVLIEGRNRELRKMFEEIGHFVEKIRRVGYGPLVLDQEPGNLRELDPRELELLRKAAEGKLRTPKTKEIRRRNAADAAQLPTVAPRATGSRPPKPFGAKSFEERPAPGPKDYRPKRSFDQGSGSARPSRPSRPSGKDFGPARPAWKKDDRPSRPASRFAAGSTGEARPPAARPYGDRPATGRSYGAKPPAGRAYEARPAAGRTYGAKPPAGRPYGAKPAAGTGYGAKPAFNKPTPNKPAWSKSGSSERPPFKRPAAPRRESPVHDDDFGPVRPPNLYIEEIHGSDRPAPSRPSAPRPYSVGPSSSRPRPERPFSDRGSSPRPGPGRSSGGRSGTARSSSPRPFRGEGGLSRPFTTSSGKPRAGGARPSSRPGTPAGPARRPFRREEPEGSFAPRTEHRTGWKPKPSFGGPKPASGARSKPGAPADRSSSRERKPGGFSKSGYKGKSSGTGGKRTGPRPGGKRPGGAPGGKKRK
jgi:23S rRNA pseudouridine2605 synthase